MSKIKKKILMLVAVILLVAAFGAGCAEKQAPSETPSEKPTPSEQPPQPEVIKIGVLLDLSGDLGAIGQKMKLGAELAQKEFDSLGGIGGKKIELVVEDAATDPAKAVEAMKKLVEVEGVKVVVGPMTSSETLAVAKYVNDRNVVIISPSATAGKITELGDDYVFRTVGSDDLQAAALLDLMKSRGYSKIATFVIANDYGIGFEDYFKKYVPEMVALSIRYDPQKGDYRTELQQVKDAGVDAIIFVGYVDSGKVVFRQAADLGLDEIDWLSSEGIAENVMFEDAKTADFMAKVEMIGTKPSSTGFTYEKFAEKHRQAFGSDPDLFSDYTYDATMLAILAAGTAPSYDGPQIREALKKVSEWYNGATGYKLFDENGDPAFYTYNVWKVVKTDTGFKYEIIGHWAPATGLELIP